MTSGVSRSQGCGEAASRNLVPKDCGWRRDTESDEQGSLHRQGCVGMHTRAGSVSVSDNSPSCPLSLFPQQYSAPPSS